MIVNAKWAKSKGRLTRAIPSEAEDSILKHVAANTIIPIMNEVTKTYCRISNNLSIMFQK